MAHDASICAKHRSVKNYTVDKRAEVNETQININSMPLRKALHGQTAEEVHEAFQSGKR